MTIPAESLAEFDEHHHEVIARLRRIGPVAWAEALGGWVVTSRELAIEVMRDADLFTVDDPRFSTAQVVGPSMLSLDGDNQRRHRQPFVDAFRPAVVAQYAELIQQTSNDLVVAMMTGGCGDLRRQLCAPLAVSVVALSLGLEGIDTQQLLSWYAAIVRSVEDVSQGLPVSESGSLAYQQLAAAVGDAQLSIGSPLAQAAQHLSAAEVASNAAVFLFGGIETSEAMTANLLHHLLTHPAQFDALRHDPALIDVAVEESLRLEPAAARVDRYATRSAQIGGVDVAAGDLVVVSLAGANRDPEFFDNPDEFDITRAKARHHLTFAQGPHACIGAQFARLEARSAVRSVIELLPGVCLVEMPRTTGVIFRKPLTVDVRW